MTLLLTLLIMAVIGLVAAVAAGRIGGGLDDPASSLPGRGLPPGPFTLEDVDRVRFSPALRGYRMDEVDDVVDRLVDELRRLEEEVAELRARRAPESPPATGRYLPGDGWAADGYGDFRRPAPTASSPPTSNDDDAAGDR